jgi:hypothetical protein
VNGASSIGSPQGQSEIRCYLRSTGFGFGRKTFLLDSYAARKLSKTTTASAARGGGSVSASTSNFSLQPGSHT